MHSAFISFEGIDGCGKSTQLRLLASRLRLAGVEVVATREPGGTPLGQQLRAALLEADSHVDPLAELLLYAADRAQHVRTLIRPALASGRVVLSDRFADATAAYQGAGRGFDPALVGEIIELATGGLRPDLTLLFDLPVATARARAGQRRQKSRTGDRIEAEDAEFHERVRAAYLGIAEREPARVRVIDSACSVEETHARVVELIMPFLETRGFRFQVSDFKSESLKPGT